MKKRQIFLGTRLCFHIGFISVMSSFPWGVEELVGSWKAVWLFGPMTFHTLLWNKNPSVQKASVLKFQVTSDDCNFERKTRGKFPLGLTLQNLGVNIYIYVCVQLNIYIYMCVN